MIRFTHPFGAALRAFFALRARPAYPGMTEQKRIPPPLPPPPPAEKGHYIAIPPAFRENTGPYCAVFAMSRHGGALQPPVAPAFDAVAVRPPQARPVFPARAPCFSPFARGIE